MTKAAVAATAAALVWATWAPAIAEAQVRRRARPPAIDVGKLSRDLAGADKAKATAAAAALGAAQPNPEALSALLDALAMGLHPEIGVAALDAVAAHKSPAAIDTVSFYLHYRDPRVRAAAVRAVNAIDDRRATGRIMTALTDADVGVRAAAIGAVADRNIRRAIEPMLELLKKGDEATAPALARMGDADLARALGEFIGVAPNQLLARALGGILNRKDFGPETARVQVVRALAKIPGAEVVEQLTNYVESVPETPPRQSRREAEAIVDSRVTGGE